MTLLERLNDGGEVFLTHTTVARPGRCCGSPSARRRPPAPHVERVWALLREGHDWLAADFAGSAARRAAPPRRPSERAPRPRRDAEAAERAAEQPQRAEQRRRAEESRSTAHAGRGRARARRGVTGASALPAAAG